MKGEGGREEGRGWVGGREGDRKGREVGLGEDKRREMD